MKTKDFAKLISNLSLYFENLFAAIFKGHPSAAVSITEEFSLLLTVFILDIISNV